MPVPEEITLNGYLYIFENQLLGAQSGVGSRTSIEIDVTAEHVGKLAFATMPDGPRTNSSHSLMIQKETYDAGESVWKRGDGLGWTGGPQVGYPGLEIDPEDSGNKLRFVLVNPDGFSVDLRLGTIEEVV